MGRVADHLEKEEEGVGVDESRSVEVGEVEVGESGGGDMVGLGGSVEGRDGFQSPGKNILSSSTNGMSGGLRTLLYYICRHMYPFN